MSLTSTLTPAQILAALRPPQRISKASFTGQGAGFFHSSLYLAGLPGAGAAPAPGVNGATLTNTSPSVPGYAGQIPFPAAVGGQSVYLAGASLSEGGNISAGLLYDRLWHNSGLVVTTTGAQAIAQPALPARDANGASSGVGCELWLEVVTATTNAGAIANMTASYTNSAGTAGRTATMQSFPANAVAGSIHRFDLAAGDIGVQSVQSITLGTSLVTGSISAVIARPIADLPVTADNLSQRQDMFQLGMPIMYDGSVPWLIYILNGAAAGRVSALLNLLQV